LPGGPELDSGELRLGAEVLLLGRDPEVGHRARSITRSRSPHRRTSLYTHRPVCVHPQRASNGCLNTHPMRQAHFAGCAVTSERGQCETLRVYEPQVVVAEVR
jgi:hypothetical protein